MSYHFAGRRAHSQFRNILLDGLPKEFHLLSSWAGEHGRPSICQNSMSFETEIGRENPYRYKGQKQISTN